MDKLNEWTISAIEWTKTHPATAILIIAATVASWKIGEAIGEALIETGVIQTQS